MKNKPVVGRFAPSPTGPLHFGSLVAAVGSWCMARREEGKWLVRMEDLDAPRTLPGAADEILRTLEFLGLAWDGEVHYQSRRIERYEAALERLRERKLIFSCSCSRREVVASAPHIGEEGPVYPGTCRDGMPPGRRPASVRIRVPQKTVCFRDGVFGSLEQTLADTVGDFVLRRADGIHAYQLAVVVDDAESGVNQVVRGADLLSSTPRQIYLQSCLGYPVPRYMHLPLVLSPEGRKLSKRDGTIGPAGRGGELVARVLSFLGQEVPSGLQEAPPAEILGWAGKHFDPDLIPREQGRVGIFRNHGGKVI